jgi:hypothetical protein
MLKLTRLLRSRLKGGDEGIALAVVIGISAVLMVLIVSALSFSVGSTTKAAADSNQDAALAAAEAGVSDYQSRLTNDNTYVKYGDPLAPFSSQTGSTTLTLPTTPTNPAFGWGNTGTWASVPGASGNTAYRYEVDNSQYASSGVIRILATGRSGTQTRSVLANLHQNGFLNFLYFTNYETQDPAITGDSQSLCTQYYPTRVDNNCGGAIQFSPGEVLDGPVGSNDAMLICGGDFKGAVTTNYAPTTGTKYYRINPCSSGSAPTFEKGPPAHGDVLIPPPTNQAMAQETRGDLTGSTVPRPGCLYTGPTSIVFNSNGTMTVKSPWTRFTNTGVSASTGYSYGMTNPACGTGLGATSAGVTASTTNTLASPGGQTIPVPTQNLIFVQSVPAATAINSSSDPNAWLSTNYPGKGVTGAAYANCPSNGNDLGYPIATTTVSGSKTTTVTENITASTSAGSYSCRTGDAFVQGTVSGQVTVATDHYVWVTGNIVYGNPATDVLGLVGNNAVWVWNPYGTTKVTTGCNNNCTTTGSLLPTVSNPDAVYPDGTKGRTIDAAIMSVQHTFQVQNFDKGGLRGILTVLGAIAQQYRGTVGLVGSTGYTKSYSYDRRFANIAPPKFLQAVSTTYGVSQLADVPAAFSSDGTSK